MFQIEKIEEPEAHAKLEDFLKSRAFLPIFFYSPYTLNTWLMHDGKSIYIATLGDERIMLTHKFREKENEIRFMFAEPSEEMIAQVTRHFNPIFIAANELVEKDPEIAVHTEYFESPEIIIDIEKTLELKDGKIRRDYRNCQRKHPELIIENYISEHEAGVHTFLDTWSGVRSELENKYAKIQNDKRFLEIYGNSPETKGFIVKDGQKIVAISFFVPGLDGNAIAVISKCLRGYTQLGVFTFIERLKRMHDAGYKHAYISSINNDFKNRFIDCGRLQEMYCHDIYRAPGFEVRKQYAFRIF